jgi:cobalt/nickel transport system permease protein
MAPALLRRLYFPFPVAANERLPKDGRVFFMHMADSLLSLPVGLGCAVGAAALVGWSAREFRRDPQHDVKVPLAGVLGAFVFAAQMVNFSIPPGASGHLGGGLLLALLLGPWAGVLAMAAVLTIQCFFFMDGGILALGANLLNLGLWPCLVGAPLYWWLIGREGPRPGWRSTWVPVLAAIVSLELGAFGVAVETLLSGRMELTFGVFTPLMLAIHLPIAVIEGLVTAGVLRFVMVQRPGLLAAHGQRTEDWRSAGMRRLIISLGLAALLTGGGLSWFASEKPDGLEYSIAKVTGHEELQRDDAPAWFKRFRQWCSHVAIFPDYQPRTEAAGNQKTEKKPAPQPSFQGNAMAALAGTALVGAVIILLSLLMHRRQIPSLALTHDHDHPHDHNHDHPHPHDHDHDHPHDHDHEHPHPHDHDHDHEHPHGGGGHS